MKPIRSILSALAALAFAATIFVAAPAANAKSTMQAKTSTAAVAPKVFTSPQKVGTKATCPISGDHFVISKSTMHAEYKGKYVYFCCPKCKKVFDKDPAKYTK